MADFVFNACGFKASIEGAFRSGCCCIGNLIDEPLIQPAAIIGALTQNKGSTHLRSALVVAQFRY